MATARAPRKPKQSPEVPPDDDAMQSASQAEDFVPEDIAVLDLLSELSDEGSVVRIYREGPGGYRDLTLIAEVGIDAFNPIMLSRPPYNGGTFRIHARAPGSGGMRVNRQLKVERDPNFKPEAPPQAAQQPQGMTLASLTPEQFAQMMATAMRTAAPIAPDPLDSMQKTVAILAPLLARGHDPAPSAPAVDPFKMLDTTLNLATKMREMSGDGGGGGATGNDLMLGLIREFAPMLREAVSKNPDLAARAMQAYAQQGEAPPAPATLAAPVPPVVSPIAAPAPAAVPPEVEDMSMRLTMGLQFLCMQAAADADPYTYASVVMDNVPEGDLKTMLDSPDWLERLAAFHAPVRNHAKWFGELKECIIEIQNAPPEDEAADATPGNKTAETPPG